MTSRFVLHDQAPLAPGCCIACRAGGKAVIDFGLSMPVYGAVYLCVDCVSEAAFVVGKVVPVEVYDAKALEAIQAIEAVAPILELVGEFNEQHAILSADFDARVNAVINGEYSVDATEGLEGTAVGEPDAGEGTPRGLEKADATSGGSGRPDLSEFDLN